MTNQALPHPRVGVGVMILNEKNQVLLGQRKASHGTGEWCFPGGHLEFGETIFQTAQREVKEETGLDVSEFELISVADELRYLKTDNKHYLNLGVKAVYAGGEPKVMEPEKCAEWKWFDLNNLPSPLFEGTQWTLGNFKEKRIYKEARR